MRFDQASDEEILNAARDSIRGFSTNGAKPSLPEFPRVPALILEFAKGFDAFFCSKSHCYALADPHGNYEERTIAEFRRDLVSKYGLRKKHCDAVITWIDHAKSVDFFGQLGGHRAGLHKFNDKRILVARGPTIIAARAGEWPILQRIFEGMFGPMQLPFVYGWLKVSRQALIDGELRPAQSLILCGPKNCGKSFTQEFVVTAMLGGRVSRPYAWMAGSTSFNSDLIAAEHWMLDDEAAPDDIKVRRTIGAQIKQIASSQTIWSHKKGDEALPLPIFRRLTISCNEDDHSLNVLPPLDEALEGKIILCRVRRSDFPWPSSNADRQELMRSVENEFPAFAYFLDNFEIPNGFSNQRYGVNGYLDPLVTSKVDSLGLDVEMLELVQIAIAKSSKGTVFPFEGAAGELFDLVFNREELRPGLLNICRSPRGLGRILTALVDREIEGISARILDGRKVYRIEEPKA